MADDTDQSEPSPEEAAQTAARAGARDLRRVREQATLEGRDATMNDEIEKQMKRTIQILRAAAEAESMGRLASAGLLVVPGAQELVDISAWYPPFDEDPCWLPDWSDDETLQDSYLALKRSVLRLGSLAPLSEWEAHLIRWAMLWLQDTVPEEIPQGLADKLREHAEEWVPASLEHWKEARRKVRVEASFGLAVSEQE